MVSDAMADRVAGERDAGEARLAVEQHRAGAAVALVAALLAAGEPEAVAQHFEQRPAWRRRDGEVGAVDVQHEDVEVGGHGSQEAGVLGAWDRDSKMRTDEGARL